jgi:hypothetical protein
MFDPGAIGLRLNPSYSGGRDQEDRSSKPAWANSSVKPYLEKTLHKKGLVELLKV